VKILLDECVDQRFRRELSGHEVSTVLEAGWAGKKNGELLSLAQSTFRVFITVDRNLHFQQNMLKLGIGVVIMSARTNRLEDLRPLAPQVLSVIGTIKLGEVALVMLAS